MIPNFILFEDAANLIPSEHKDKFLDVDWSDQTFTTFSICSSSMMEYEISEEELYLRFEDDSIEKQDYTGDIEFATIIPKDEDDMDYELSFKALYFKGDLKELTFLEVVGRDQSVRRDAQEKVMEAIKDHERKQSSVFYKLYSFYSKAVDFVFTFFRYIFASIIKFLWFIQNKIT